MGMDDYHTWQLIPASVRGHAVRVATKPGVFAHGRVDPSAALLAQHVAVRPGTTVLHMNCGNGMFALAAADAGAARVLLTDRSVVAVAAATRTIAANPG